MLATLLAALRVCVWVNQQRLTVSAVQTAWRMTTAAMTSTTSVQVRSNGYCNSGRFTLVSLKLNTS